MVADSVVVALRPIALRHVGSSHIRDRTRVSCIGRQILFHSHQGSPVLCFLFLSFLFLVALLFNVLFEFDWAFCRILFYLFLLFLWGFLGCTIGKEPTCQCRKHKRRGFDPWVGNISWRRARQPTPVFLPGESHGQRSLAGHSPHRATQSWMHWSNLAGIVFLNNYLVIKNKKNKFILPSFILSQIFFFSLYRSRFLTYIISFVWRTSFKYFLQSGSILVVNIISFCLRKSLFLI